MTFWCKEKMGLKMGFYQKWVCSRSAQKHKDLKKKLREISEGRLRSLEKCFFFFFFGEEMVRWRRKVKWRRSWIVLMVEERWRKEKAKKRKKETRKVGGQYSAPTLKTQQVAESTPKKKFLFLFLLFLFFSSSS